MAVKPPTSVKMGHITMKVVHDQTLVDEYAIRERTNVGGWSHLPSQTIAIGLRSAAMGNLPHEAAYQRETLLHEILHSCLRISGCDPDADARQNLSDVEERAVLGITNVLLNTLRDNPELVAYLLAEEESDDLSELS